MDIRLRHLALPALIWALGASAIWGEEEPFYSFFLNPPNILITCNNLGGDCECKKETEGSNVDCTMLSAGGGLPEPWSGLGPGMFRIPIQSPSLGLFSPQGLSFVPGQYGVGGVSAEKNTSGAPLGVRFFNSDGASVPYYFDGGSSDASPVTSVRDMGATKVIMVDAQGDPVTSNPEYYDLHDGKGEVYRFGAKSGTDDFGRLVQRDTPSGFTETPAEAGIEVVTDANGVLRQVVTASRFSDIAVLSDQKYAIRIYPRYQLGGGKDGDDYYVPPTNRPLDEWVIENPDTATVEKLRITRITGSKTNVTDFTWTEGSKQWELKQGGGMRRITRSASWNDSKDRVLFETLMYNPGGGTDGKKRETYMPYRCSMLIVDSDSNPDDGTPADEYDYYGPADGPEKDNKLKSVKFGDGSWVQFDYDSEGRLSKVIRPFGDTSFGTPASQASETTYSYSSHDAGDTLLTNDQRPRTVTKKVQGEAVSLTFHAYMENASGEYQEIAKQAVSPSATFSDSGNLTTVRTYYDGDAALYHPYRLKSVLHPDGRLDTYTYTAGTLSNPGTTNCTFSADTNGVAWQVSVKHGTTNEALGVVVGKSTVDVRVFDRYAREALTETHVVTGEHTKELISRTIRAFDDGDHPVTVYRSDGTKTMASWGSNCCGKETDTDAAGTVRTYGYDLVSRLTTVTKKGVTNTQDIVTTYTYDAAGRRLTTTVTNSASGLSLLTSSNVYDTAGRVTRSVDAQGIAATYTYTANASTVVRAGLTNETARYLDGRTKYSKVNGVLKTTYEYGIDEDEDLRYTVVYTGPDGTASPVRSMTVTDALGRTLREERPGFGGTVITNSYSYDSYGRLEKTQRTGAPATLYAYDDLGNRTRTAVDVANYGTIDLDGLDRVTDSDSYYAEDSQGEIWRVSETKVYATADSGTATVTGIQSNRLTGLSSDLTSEAVSVDIHGNRTVTKSSVDAAAKTVTRTVDRWDSTNDASSVTVNGLLLTNVTKTALTYTYAYDGLERRTGVTDPRTGSSVTHYNGKSQVDYVEDATGNRTSYAYDEATGRRIAVTNALGKVTRYDHDAEGHLLKTWGDTAYPVKYAYDDYDRMSNMTTYRGGSDWDGADWPDPEPDGDETTWIYDEPTGLLTNKVYDDENGVTYAYTANGRLRSRTWARGITTDYRYDALGQLTNIDYNASATNVSFTYDRIGRQETVTDALGTRSFSYNDALQLAIETNALGVIARSYDAGTGRNTGFDLDGILDVGYAYGAMGRFDTVTWTNAATGGPEQRAQYAYLAGSDLLRELSINDGDLTQTRVYEPDRNLIAAISNAAGGTVVSVYGYGNDDLGRRTNRVDSGTAFTAATTNDFGYNTRSELTSADMGTDDYRYAYDNIGNRTAYTNNSEAWAYLANSLNQYTNIADGTTNDLLYDLDGNLTNDGIRAYSWNGENRLIGVEPLMPAAGDQKVALAYDYIGRRIAKVVSTYSGGWSVTQTNRFSYDGWNLVQETVRSSLSIVTNHFVWGLDLSGTLQGAGGIGGLIAWSRSDTTTNFLYCYDANGNVGQLVDAADTTNVVASYGPDPFGNMATTTGSESSRNPFRFSTKYTDDETELVYYGFRYYAPEMGRWLRLDPLGEYAGSHRYAFVANKSGSSVDFLGLASLPDDRKGYAKSECCDQLRAAFAADPNLRAQVAKLQKDTVPGEPGRVCLFSIYCDPCSNLVGGMGSGGEYAKKRRPKWYKNLDPEWIIVVFCKGTYPGSSDPVRTLYHEVQHAAENCWRKDRPDSCRDVCCEEARARFCSGMSEKQSREEAWFSARKSDECVKEKATKEQMIEWSSKCILKREDCYVFRPSRPAQPAPK